MSDWEQMAQFYQQDAATAWEKCEERRLEAELWEGRCKVMLVALKHVEAEMRAGFGSSFGETREQVRRAIAKGEGR